LVFRGSYPTGRSGCFTGMRLKTGGRTRHPVDLDAQRMGTVLYLKADDFTLTPLEWWKSAATAGNTRSDGGWRCAAEDESGNIDATEEPGPGAASLAYWRDSSMHGSGWCGAVTGARYLD